MGLTTPNLTHKSPKYKLVANLLFSVGTCLSINKFKIFIGYLVWAQTASPHAAYILVGRHDKQILIEYVRHKLGSVKGKRKCWGGSESRKLFLFYLRMSGIVF